MGLAKVLTTVNESELPGAVTIKVLVSLGGLLLLWRVWRFTILPKFHPTEPQTLPYWIPCKCGFVKTTDDLFKANHNYKYRSYFNSTREIFSVIIAGQKIYIVTSPKDISTVYKNPQNLTFNGFIRDMYTNFGMSPRGVEQMFEPIASTHDPADDIHRQQHAHLATGVQNEQLHPGQNLDGLIRVYLNHIEQQMDPKNLPDSCIVRPSGGHTVVSLRKWCSAVLGAATVEAFFGNVLLTLDPQLLDDFNIFDVDSWMLLYRYPRIAAKPLYSALERTTSAFTRYFELPSVRRSQACHYIRTVEAKQRKAGMSNRDISIAAQGLFWAANANHHKICFWLIAHIVSDPTLLDVIRKEISPAVSHGRIDVSYLIKECPVYDAALNETLRLTTGAMSARTVDAETPVGHQTLYPNAKLLIPYRQLHYDESFFGPDIETFNHRRFLDNKDLQKSPYFKPFGGGLTYCSGRFLARREVLALAAMILTQYSLKWENKEEGFPRLDLNKPNVGVMDSMPGDDVLLELRPRVSGS